MLDRDRAQELTRYLRQFCQDAFSEGAAAATTLHDATLIIESILAEAAGRWNAAATINQLPNSTLAAIFAYLTCEERWPSMRVCRHWRQVATSEPRLWTKLILKSRAHSESSRAVDRSDSISWQRPSFLRPLLHWSAALPLDLTMYGASGPFLDEFLAAYPAISKRLRSLHLDFLAWYDKGVELGETLGRPAPVLEHLVLHPNSTVGSLTVTIGSLFQAPRLKTLSVTRVNLPESITPVPSTTKLRIVAATNDDSPYPWMKRILHTFPNLEELQLPNFKYEYAWKGMTGTHRLRSVTVGQQSYTVPHRLVSPPPLNFTTIPRVQLFWPTRAVTQARLAADLQGPLRSCEITTTHWNAFTVTVSDARDFLREFTVPYTEFKRFFADSQRLFDTATSITASNALFPDSFWELVASLPRLEQVIIRASVDTGRRLLAERPDEKARQAAPHPSLRRLIIETDRGSPPVATSSLEIILRSRVGLDMIDEGSRSRGVLVNVEYR